MMWYILYYVLKQGYIVYGDQHPGRWGLYIYTGKKLSPKKNIFNQINQNLVKLPCLNSELNVQEGVVLTTYVAIQAIRHHENDIYNVKLTR